jgi:photosynthetic reaction center cytochrome c subunit
MDPLIELYKQQGNTAKATELSDSLMAAIHGQSAQTESLEKPSTATSPQTAGTVFKNIQVLKAISSDQLIPTMRFISASLGVECGYCHVPNAFEKDDKKPKQVARNMMRMMFAIDKNSFEGNREITCYSCHKGSTKPDATPIVAAENQPQTVADSNTEKLPVSTLTADQ